MRECTITLDDNGIRLDRWFKRYYPGISHGFLEKYLRKGLIRVDGKKAKSSDRIVAGQRIRVPPMQNSDTVRPVKKPAEISVEDAKEIQRLVIYKDTNVMALNKPHGLAVQGGTRQAKHIDGLLDALRFDAKERPKLVHRLDRDTSGVMLLARNTKAATLLTQAFAQKTTRKIYWALVVGVPRLAQGTVDLPLIKKAQGITSRMEGFPSPNPSRLREGDNYSPRLRGKIKRGKERVGVDAEEGKYAITHYRVVEAMADKYCWLELLPVTGRTHQLRVHMAEIGHPIVGDGKYGGAEAFIRGMDISDKLHLHAQRIIVPRIFGKTLDIAAPLPKHMQESWKHFGFSAKGPDVSITELME